MRSHAFVIGNSDYVEIDEFPRIRFAKNDAERIYALLTNSSSSIFSTTTSICRLNLDRDALENALDSFFEPIESADLVLFYFAGHAKVLRGKKRLFLTMTDTNSKKLARTAFSVDNLLPYLEEKNLQRYIVILDCCRAGIALDSPGVKNRGLIDNAELQFLSGQGKVFVASSLDYQLAYELDSLEHGLFGHYFIEGIKTGKAANSHAEYITISDLSSYIHQQMNKDYPDISQEPIMSGEDLVGELIVAKNPTFIPENIESSVRISRPNVASVEKLRYLTRACSELRSGILNYREHQQMYRNALIERRHMPATFTREIGWGPGPGIIVNDENTEYTRLTSRINYEWECLPKISQQTIQLIIPATHAITQLGTERNENWSDLLHYISYLRPLIERAMDGNIERAYWENRLDKTIDNLLSIESKLDVVIGKLDAWKNLES